MLKIGLTGGIGSGKSIIANVFRVLGIPVFDADDAAKRIMQVDEILKAGVIEAFGAGAYTNGQLNRKYLANIVFKDTHQLEVLNALVHPATIRAAQQWFEQQQAPYVVKEAALLFEAGTAGDMDYVVGVYAPQHIRIKRVMDRDKVERDDVLNRMSKQINEEMKMRLCDYVIVNDEQQPVIPQVLELHKKFLVTGY